MLLEFFQERKKMESHLKVGREIQVLWNWVCALLTSSIISISKDYLKLYASAEYGLIENQILHSVRPDQIIEHDLKLARLKILSS